MRGAAWCWLALLFAGKQASAEVRPLSLREAVSLAVRHNPELAASSAAFEAARARVVEARGLDDPLLAASTAVERTRRARAQGAPVQEQAVDAVRGGLALVQPLPIGGRVGLQLEGARRRTEFVVAGAPTPPSAVGPYTVEQYTPALSLSFEQPLLRGSGVEVARAERYRTAARRDIARAERQRLAISLVRDVVTTYWAVAHAQGEVEIRMQSASAAREQLERVRAHVVVGKLPSSATAELDVAIALREDAVLLAAQRASEREIALTRLCGAPSRARLSATDPLPQPGSIEGTQSAMLARSWSQNPTMAALRAQTRAAAVDLGVARDAVLPRLDLSLTGGSVASASDVDAAFAQIRGFDGYSAMAQLSFELPLGSHAARGERDAARAELGQVEQAQRGARGRVTAGVLEALAVLQTARRRRERLEPVLQAATLDLEAARARFDAGRGDSFDVLRRQDALAAVQLTLLSTRLAWSQAKARLDASTGEILERHGLFAWTEPR